MKTQCPHCRTFFNVKPEYIGKKAKCKKCAQGFIMLEAQGVPIAYEATALAGTTVIPGAAATVAPPQALAGQAAEPPAKLRPAQPGPDMPAASMKEMPSGPSASAVPRQNAFPSQGSGSFEHKAPQALNPFEAQAVARVVPLESKNPVSVETEIQATALPVADISLTGLPPRALPEFDKGINVPLRGLPDSQPSAPAIKAVQAMMPPAPAASRPLTNNVQPLAVPVGGLPPQMPAPQVSPQPLPPASSRLQPIAAAKPLPQTPPASPGHSAPGLNASTRPDGQKVWPNAPGQNALSGAPANSPLRPVPPKPLVQSPMLPSRQPGLKRQSLMNQSPSAAGRPAFQPRPPHETAVGERPQEPLRPARASAVQVPPAMTRNMPGPHIAQLKVETPAPPPKKVIPTSWTAPLPTEVLIDGQLISPSVYDDDPAYAQACAAPLPLDVQHRFDDQQVVTVELYDGPLAEKNEEKDASLIFSPIELDENQGKGGAAGALASALKIASKEAGASEDSLFVLEGGGDLTMELRGLASESSSLFAYPHNDAARTAAIAVVDRLPLTETKALKIGAVEGRSRRALKPKSMMPKRAPQFPPPGVRPPMFPRVAVAPDHLVAPEFIEEYVPKGPGPMVKAVVVGGRTIYRAFKSVSIAGYWFLKRQFDKVPRPVLTSSLACLLIGMLAGAWILYVKSSGEIKELKVAVSHSQELLQSKQSGKIESLYKERDRLSEDLLRVAAISREYPEGSIPRALAMAASEEFKIADALLLQQIAAIESGAKVTVAVKQTTPDPNLASTLEEEMDKLQNDIGRQVQSARNLGQAPKMLADTSIATQLVSLAILNRNHLIAKYGLSSPLPMQYQSGAYASDLDRKVAQAGSDEPGFTNDQLPGLLEDLRQEVERLRAENELLLNSDSTLYASAVTDMGVGHLNSARDKFTKLLKVYPSSNLVPKTHEGLAQVKVMTAQKEAAKKPPVQVSYTSVRHDGGYFKNETYVRVSFRNVSNMMIKRMEFQVLTFDEHGYPVGSKRLSMTDDNTLSAAMAENVAPGKADYGVWELSDKVRQVKVKLKEVEFYEAPIWRDEDIERWVEKESARFVQAKGKRS